MDTCNQMLDVMRCKGDERASGSGDMNHWHCVVISYLCHAGSTKCTCCFVVCLTYTDFIVKDEVIMCDASLNLILEYILAHSRQLNYIVRTLVLVLLCLLKTNVSHRPSIHWAGSIDDHPRFRLFQRRRHEPLDAWLFCNRFLNSAQLQSYVVLSVCKWN